MTLSPTTKRLLAVFGFLLVAAVFAVLLYVVLFRPSGPAANTNEVNGNAPGGLPSTNGGSTNRGPLPSVNGFPSQNANGTTGLPDIPTVAQGGATLTTEVTGHDSAGLTVRPDGNAARYYDRVTGKFYEVSAAGDVRELSSQTFFNVASILWSPSQSSALLTYPDGRTIYYEFETGRQTSLPLGSREFSFAASGLKITFKYAVGGRELLVVANPDGTQIEAVADLGENEEGVIPTWSPSSEIVAFSVETLNDDQQEVFPIGLQGENFKSFIVNGFDFRGHWSPAGTRMVYSVYNAASDYKPTLSVVDVQGDTIGQNHVALGLETWADKCTFASDTFMYCAVPNGLPSSSGLYPELAVDTSDSVYEIDLRSGTRRVIAIPVGTDGTTTFRAVNLQVTPDQQFLYFTDERTGTIQKLQLR